MFPIIYIEDQLSDHPTTKRICEKFPDSARITCQRYTEIFNKKSQNFRLQKQNPSLIIAKKNKNFVLPTPTSYGIGGKYNYYFSHMLNCLYDCRYCFLQGMYSSANYVLFTNYEDFKESIDQVLSSHPPDEDVYFFSGYDCDSLAMESVTHFFDSFYEFFKNRPRAFLELRTKSYQINPLLKKDPIENCITAFTLSPDAVAKKFEIKAPAVHKRIEAIQKLQKNNWPVAIRLDPLIYVENFLSIYGSFIKDLQTKINFSSLHSITIGTFRLPRPIFKNVLALYPNEPLLNCSLNEEGEQIGYGKSIEKEMIDGIYKVLLNYIKPHKIFTMNQDVGL